MPKKIDDELKVRAVRLVNDHQGEYSASGQALTVVVPTMATAKAHANDAGSQSPGLGGPICVEVRAVLEVAIQAHRTMRATRSRRP